jgi:hypothetical protein
MTKPIIDERSLGDPGRRARDAERLNSGGRAARKAAFELNAKESESPHPLDNHGTGAGKSRKSTGSKGK